MRVYSKQVAIDYNRHPNHMKMTWGILCISIWVLFCAASSIIHLDCNQKVLSLRSVCVGLLGQLLAKLAANSPLWAGAVPSLKWSAFPSDQCLLLLSMPQVTCEMVTAYPIKSWRRHSLWPCKKTQSEILKRPACNVWVSHNRRGLL